MSKPHDNHILFNLLLSCKLLSFTGAGSNAEAPPLTNIIIASFFVAFSNLEITSFPACKPLSQGTGWDAPITSHPSTAIIFSKFVTASALNFASFGNTFKKQFAILHAAFPIDIITYLPSSEIIGIGFAINDLDNAASGFAAFTPSKNALWAFFLKVFISILINYLAFLISKYMLGS